jgi:hypothetical protein
VSIVRTAEHHEHCRNSLRVVHLTVISCAVTPFRIRYCTSGIRLFSVEDEYRKTQRSAGVTDGDIVGGEPRMPSRGLSQLRKCHWIRFKRKNMSFAKWRLLARRLPDACTNVEKRFESEYFKPGLTAQCRACTRCRTVARRGGTHQPADSTMRRTTRFTTNSFRSLENG